jgi:hypothetical protein
LPMASSTSRSLRLGFSTALALGLVIGSAILSERINVIGDILAWSWIPAVVLSLVLLAAAAGVAFALPRPALRSAEEALPEPVVPQPTVPQCRRQPAVISVHGLEAQAGCTSIAFNLAVEVAATGLIDGRRPRPICLLRDGPLTRTVGLDPRPVTEYCRSHMATVGEDVIELAERHPSGCEVLCVADGVLDGHRLRLLASVLRQFYDLVLIDCPPGDRWLTDSAFDASEVSLLVGLPTDESARAAVPWSDMSWRYGLDARFALLINRLTADQSIPHLLAATFANVAVIPEDAAPGNALELPWVLRRDSRVGRAISEIAVRVLPDLAAKDQSHAA